MTRSTPSLNSAMPTDVLSFAGGQQRRFVDQVRQVGADEAGGDRGDFLQVDVGSSFDVLHVDFEDRLRGRARRADRPARGDRSGRDAAGPDRAFRAGCVAAITITPLLRVEAVHLDQQRVERLLAFVVAADDAAAAGFAERVELVDEDDARRLWLRPAGTCRGRGPRRRRRTFRRSRSRDRLKNGTPASPAMALASSVLPVPGGPTSSTPLGMRPPSIWYFSGLRRNSTTSRSFFHRFVDAGHVFESDADIFLGVQLAAAAAERHRAAGPAQAAHHEEEEQHEQAGDHQHRHIAFPGAGTGGFRKTDIVFIK